MTPAELRFILPDFHSLEESIFKEDEDTLGFQTSVILNSGYCLGTGFHPSSSKTARLIGLNEAIERRLARNLAYSPQRSEFLLDEYPTTCGFAVGLDRESTRVRALAESVERWIRSKWIDDGFFIPMKIINSNYLSSSEFWFYRQFDQVLSYEISHELKMAEHVSSYKSLIVVGIKGNGAFVGSKTACNDEPPFISALVEAWRHLILAKSSSTQSEMGVIRHFAENKNEALRQISRAQKMDWPEPRIRLLKEVPTAIRGLFCYRALLHDFRGWHGDDVTRFVY